MRHTHTQTCKYTLMPTAWRPLGLLFLAAAIVFAAAGNGRADKGDGRIDAAVLKTVRRATVYLRVTLPDGEVVQGSGFFAVTRGLVLTNAHVLGMLRPRAASRPRWKSSSIAARPTSEPCPASTWASIPGPISAPFSSAPRTCPTPSRSSRRPSAKPIRFSSSASLSARNWGRT